MPTPPCVHHEASTVSSRTSSAIPQETWLDLLPLEVTYKIIPCLNRTSCTNPLLPLAKTSPHLLAAVNTVLSDGEMRHASWEITASHAALRRLDIDSTVQTASSREAVDRYRSFVQRLREGEWSAARIHAGERLSVKLIARRSKSLSFCSKPADGGVRIFRDVAFGRGIVELSVECTCAFDMSTGTESRCLVGQTMDHVLAYGKPAESSVRKLDLDCKISYRNGYAKIMSTFDNLQEASFRGLPNVDDDVAARLQSLHSLRVRDVVKRDISNVYRVGQSVTHLSVCDAMRGDHLRTADLRRFAYCPKLESLSVTIARGAEMGLIHLPTSLRELRLSWRSHLQYSFVHRRQPYAVKPGIVCDFVEKCPDLSVLHLSGAALSGAEVVQILQVMRERVVELTVSVLVGEGTFDDAALETLLAIVVQAAISNHNLRRFELSHLGGPGYLSENCTAPPSWMLLAAFNVLRRRALRLDTTSLEVAIALRELKRRIDAEDGIRA